MRTLVLAALVALGAAALGATRTVEVDGEKVKLDAKEFATKEPVEVEYRLYTATRGPDKVLALVGYVTSNLPHEWFKITITGTAFYGYKDQAWPLGFIGPAGEGVVTLLKPVPGVRQRLATFFKQPDGKVLRPDMIHYSTVTAEYVKLEAEAPKK